MTSKIAQNPNILDKMNQMITDAQALGVMIPPELQNADPQVVIDYLTQVQSTAGKTEKVIGNVEDAANREKIVRLNLENQNQQIEMTPISTNAPATPIAAFNLKKHIKQAQGYDDFSLQNDNFNKGDMIGMSEFNPSQKFRDSYQLKQFLEPLTRQEAQDILMPNISDDLQDSFSSLMQAFYEEGDMFLSDEDKLRIAGQVFDILPDSSKEEPEDTGNMPAKFIEFNDKNLISFVNDVNENIKKLASKELPKSLIYLNLPNIKVWKILLCMVHQV
jgi:hypothetical protein